MRYISDSRALPGFGQFTQRRLAYETAAGWLDDAPYESRLRSPRIAALLGGLARRPVIVDPGGARANPFPTLTMRARDQALLCSLEGGSDSRPMRDLSLDEQYRHLTIALLTCREGYAYGPEPSCPVTYQWFPVVGPPPRRFVYSAAVLPSEGGYHFGALTREQATAWLGVGPVTSRLRLPQLAAAFASLTGCALPHSTEASPPMSAGDQALVFFLGHPASGAPLRSLLAQDIREVFDLGLLTCLE